MTLLKHPTADTIIDVTGARATTLKARGYTEVSEADVAAQHAGDLGTRAVQPQPPIDARPNPPESPIEARPADMVGEQPIDTRPPNPLGPTADSVAEADGAELVEEHPAAAGTTDGTAVADGNDADAQPAKSANKDEWVTYAQAQGVDNAGDLTKAQLVERFTD